MDQPKTTLEAFLQMDAQGKGLSTDGFQEMKAYTMWDQAPGWDTIAVITGYTIDHLQAGENRAKAQVTYKRIGTLANRFEPAGPETVTYFIRKEGGAWRVDAPQLMPHVDVKVMEDRLKHQEEASPEMMKVNHDLLKQLEAADPAKS